MFSYQIVLGHAGLWFVGLGPFAQNADVVLSSLLAQPGKGIQPWRLVCGGAWADEGPEPKMLPARVSLQLDLKAIKCSLCVTQHLEFRREPELAHLAHQLQRRARKCAEVSAAR